MKIFVYGTLKVGGRFFDALRMNAPSLRVIDEDRKIPGRLYEGDGIGFPAARFDEEGIIKGQLFEVSEGDKETTLKVLDRIEGAPKLYSRKWLDIDGDAVLTYEGRDAVAWMVPADGIEWDNEKGKVV